MLELLCSQDFQNMPNHFCAWWKPNKDVWEHCQKRTEETISSIVHFPFQWSSCIPVDAKSGRTEPFPLQLLPKEGAVEYKPCFINLMGLRKGHPREVAQSLISLMYLESKMGTSVHCTCEQIPCLVHSLDNVFLHSSAGEVETVQRRWVRCLQVKWLNAHRVRSLSYSQKTMT